MRQKMTATSRKELLAVLRPLYAEVSWKEKQVVLSSFVAATGYNRKYAIALLNNASRERKDRAGRGRKYDLEVCDALIKVWKASNRICAKRLVPFLPTMVESLERFGHLSITDDVREKLLSISHASADRLLKQERKKISEAQEHHKAGISTKKTYSDQNIC